MMQFSTPIYKVFFQLVPPKNHKFFSVSKFWQNFFDGIYYVIWRLELLGGHQLKKNTLCITGVIWLFRITELILLMRPGKIDIGNL